MKKALLTVVSLFALGLVSCVTTPVAPTGPSPEVTAQEAVPVEWPRCPTLESRWGAVHGPSLQLNGRQAITYRDPAVRGRRVQITYEGATQPRQITSFDGTRASDGKLTIMGQQVDFYGSGNEDAEISTQPVALTGPDGVTSWFSFSFSSKEHLKGKNIPAFTW